MINRIVRLSFEPEKVNDFLIVFENSKQLIASFPGCEGLRLLRDANHPHVYYTYSLWQKPENLEQYRTSELFTNTWAQTKILFNDKPMAWSTEVVEHVK